MPDILQKDTAVRYMLQPFRKFFDDPEITEICVNRPGEVFCEKCGKWAFFPVPALTMDYLRQLGIAVAKFANTDLSETSPIVSAVLPGGERSQFVMPPACFDGTFSITIRKPSFHVRTMQEYLADGFFDYVQPEQALSAEDRELIGMQQAYEAEKDPKRSGRLRYEFLQRAVVLGKNIIIAGETGSGKTTFMKTLMQSIPKDQRLITIEDVPELIYGLQDRKNIVNLLYPSEAKEDAVITAASLMRSCLRMKPDRILLAELRGGETYDFLNVCLSGHSGTITSCHSGSCSGVFDYLNLKVMQSPTGSKLPYETIDRLLHKVLDIIVCIHNDKYYGKGRHITEMYFSAGAQAARKAFQASGKTLDGIAQESAR
jgi:P-type DNA transfer ATPase VirB11